ncbi:MAG: DUF2059 domain-containing protein [Pseudomonadota bacterium]
MPALAAALIAFPAAAQDAEQPEVAPVEQAPSESLTLATQIIDIAYPIETRAATFQGASKQMEAQMLQSLEGIIADEGALAALKQWQEGMSVKTDKITERYIPSIMQALKSAYADIYTEQELRDILAFVSTPSGKSFLQKTNYILSHPAVTAASQSHMNEIMALIPEEIPALVQRIKDSKAAQTEASE